jgi:homospermidine synthase
MKHVAFPGNLVMVGFGSIGQGVLPLILRHIDMRLSKITIVTAEERGREVAAEYGVKFVQQALTRDNYREVLEPLLGKGDFLLNLSVDVSSVALIKLANEKGALYLDTCIEPWAGGYTDPTLTPSQRSNYALRESALALAPGFSGGPTAVLTHGANPGLVSHFVKEALLQIARDTGDHPLRLGRARALGRRQGDPHRRARHAGRRRAEAPGRVRQHLVDRRLRRRGQPALRARLGHA